MDIFKQIREKLKNSYDNSETSSQLDEIQDANDQSLDEIKIVEHVRSKVDEIKQSSQRISLEANYMTNVAYLLGFDGVFYDTTYRQFKNTDAKRKQSKSRFKVNKILPTTQNRLARITQSPPKYDVRPNSNSVEDKDASRLALHVLDDIFERQRFGEKRQDIHMLAMQGGYSYAQVLWDPNLGKPMIDPETGELVGFEGDVRIEVLNCLEVFPDPLAKTLEDCQYIIKAKVRKLDYFRERYPKRGKAVKEESAWLLSALNDLKSNSMASTGVAGASTQEQMKNSAIEIVYYEKRTKEYPNGRKICTANGILLSDDELPVGEYDIVKFDDIIVGGRFAAESIITHMRPIQDQYNIARTKMAEWIRKLLAGKYLAPKGAALSQESLNDQSGEVVEYTNVPNGGPPQAMQIPAIPQYAYKELEILDQEFDQISGINEISRGVLPSASIPAQGMAFLQEQDQTRIGVQTTRNEIGYSKIGQLILMYVGKNYEMSRVIKIAGDGLEYAVKDFMGADLRDNYDCIVIPGSTIPSSKVLRRQDIANAFGMGILGTPEDPRTKSKVLSMMEYGFTEEMWKDQALDEAQVKRIIDAVEKKQFERLKGVLNEYDDHAYHLLVMNRYRKSEKFDKFDPEQKETFLFIMDWRFQALVNINNPQIQQQQNMAQMMVNNQGQMDAQGGQLAPPPQQEPVINEPKIA